MWRSAAVTLAVVASLSNAACDDDDDNNSNNGNDAMTDSQVLAVTAAINQGEIDQANAARPKLSDDDARDYADMMVSEHTDKLNDQSELGIAPEENPTSAQLKAKSAQVVAQLQAEPAGSSYDRTYLQSQVDGHTEALNLIDTMLIPSADTDKVHDYLDDLREHVVDHLSDAQDILDDLGG